LIKQLKTSEGKIHLSLNLECVESMIGVSSSCISGGFTTLDMISLFYETGKQLGTLVASIDVCEYNPCVEDWRTGRQLAAFFYYFALGLSEGLQMNQQN
jgi:arginase family enzyme